MATLSRTIYVFSQSLYTETLLYREILFSWHFYYCHFISFYSESSEDRLVLYVVQETCCEVSTKYNHPIHILWTLV